MTLDEYRNHMCEQLVRIRDVIDSIPDDAVFNAADMRSVYESVASLLEKLIVAFDKR